MGLRLNFHCEHHHNKVTQARCGVCIMRFDCITNTDANIYVIKKYICVIKWPMPLNSAQYTFKV